MSIFKYKDYQSALSDIIKNSKKSENRVNFSDLAQAMRVQKTYVTRVLKHKAHFSSDQLHLCCEYLKLSPEETHFIFLLLEHGRSNLASRRKQLYQQIREIQVEAQNTRKHLGAQMIEPKNEEGYSRYYLDPFVPLIHMFLNIETFAKSPQLICARIHISESRLKAAIKIMEDLKILTWDSLSSSYKILQNHIQLVSNSPLNLPFQIFQRNNTIQRIQSQNPDGQVNVSVNFSADEATKILIHENFLKFLKSTEALVQNAPSEEVYQLNFDLFGWN